MKFYPHNCEMLVVVVFFFFSLINVKVLSTQIRPKKELEDVVNQSGQPRVYPEMLWVMIDRHLWKLFLRIYRWSKPPLGLISGALDTLEKLFEMFLEIKTIKMRSKNGECRRKQVVDDTWDASRELGLFLCEQMMPPEGDIIFLLLRRWMGKP